MDISVSAGDRVYKDGQCGSAGCVVTVEKVTATGRIRCSDGTLYGVPSPVGFEGDWSAIACGDAWAKGVIRPLTQARKDTIETASLLAKASKVRDQISMPNYREIDKETAAKILLSWELLASLVQESNRQK